MKIKEITAVVLIFLLVSVVAGCGAQKVEFISIERINHEPTISGVTLSTAEGANIYLVKIRGVDDGVFYQLISDTVARRSSLSSYDDKTNEVDVYFVLEDGEEPRYIGVVSSERSKLSIYSFYELESNVWIEKENYNGLSIFG